MTKVSKFEAQASTEEVARTSTQVKVSGIAGYYNPKNDTYVLFVKFVGWVDGKPKAQTMPITPQMGLNKHCLKDVNFNEITMDEFIALNGKMEIHNFSLKDINNQKFPIDIRKYAEVTNGLKLELYLQEVDCEYYQFSPDGREVIGATTCWVFVRKSDINKEKGFYPKPYQGKAARQLLESAIKFMNENPTHLS